MHDLFTNMQDGSNGKSTVSIEATTHAPMHAKVIPKAKCARAVHIGCPHPKSIGTRQGLTRLARLFTLTDRVPRAPRVPESTARIDMNYFFHIATCLGQPTASDWIAAFLRLG